MKKAILITAILFTSLTVNVMTYFPCRQTETVALASYTPPQINIKAILHDLDHARGEK